MKIKTELLQKMVAKVIQGASNNKIIPITSLIGIQFDRGNFILTTTDGSNILKINQYVGDMVDLPNFYTVVNADTFAKLVGKTTKEFIELTNMNNYLEVKGNGVYKLELAINEEGQLVKFPEIKNLSSDELDVNLKDLQNAIKVARASVAKTMEVPCLTGYYIANNMIATDREMICILKNELLSQPILISNEMAELLLLVDGDEIIKLLKEDNNLIFYNDNYTIAGKELEGKENYPVKQIINLADTTYENIIKVNKQELLNVLDRMNLFVDDYDKGGIFLDFTPASLAITSQKSNAAEELPIIKEEGKEVVNFNCLIDIEKLKLQLETLTTEEVEIAYGQDTSIKIVDGDFIHIISLAEK